MCERSPRSICRLKAFRLFVHTFQLVVKVFETAPAYCRRVNSALAIVKKVNKPCRATERLLHLAGKKQVKTCTTRWDS